MAIFDVRVLVTFQLVHDQGFTHRSYILDKECMIKDISSSYHNNKNCNVAKTMVFNYYVIFAGHSRAWVLVGGHMHALNCTVGNFFFSFGRLANIQKLAFEEIASLIFPAIQYLLNHQLRSLGWMGQSSVSRTII